ncbi:MAG: hypothetical protein WCL60_01245 [Methylococcales bacterium]
MSMKRFRVNGHSLGYVHGHSLLKMGVRVFRGLVIAVIAVIAVFFAMPVWLCVGLAMTESLLIFFIKKTYDRYDRYDHTNKIKGSGGHSPVIVVIAI